MPKLIDLVSDDDLEEMLPGIEKSAAVIRARKEKMAEEADGDTKPRLYVPSLTWDDAYELSIPQFRFFHSLMLQGANKLSKKERKANWPYTHIRYGFNMSEAVRHWLDMDKYQSNNMSGWMASNFAANKMGERKERGRSQTWYVRVWPKDEKIRVFAGAAAGRHFTPAIMAEAERQEARQPEQRVTTEFDMAAIPLPTEFNPQTSVEWAAKVIKLVQAQNKVLRSEQDANEALRTQITEMEEAIEKMNTDEWDQARERLAALMAGEE